MFLYENKISGMIHNVIWPTSGPFIETSCGVKLTYNDPVYEGDNVTCGACKIEMAKDG